MTPAIASEPYCAAAPSRSTSTRLMRDAGNQVHVDGSAAAADRAVDVEQRGDVAALAVDEHQGLVGAEAAQRRRTKRVGAVGDRRLREVEATGPAG